MSYTSLGEEGRGDSNYNSYYILHTYSYLLLLYYFAIHTNLITTTPRQNISYHMPYIFRKKEEENFSLSSPPPPPSFPVHAS